MKLISNNNNKDTELKKLYIYKDGNGTETPLDKKKMKIKYMWPIKNNLSLEEYIGYVAYRIYRDQKSSCKKRRHRKPNYSVRQLLNWLLQQPNLIDLIEGWKASGFNKNLTLSADRLDNSKSYSLDNIQLTTWNQNRYNNIETIKNPVEVYFNPPTLTEPRILFKEFASATDCTIYLQKHFGHKYDIKNLFANHRILGNHYRTVLTEFILVNKNDPNKDESFRLQWLAIKEANNVAIIRIDMDHNGKVIYYKDANSAGRALMLEESISQTIDNDKLKHKVGAIFSSIQTRIAYKNSMWVKESDCNKEVIEELIKEYKEREKRKQKPDKSRKILYMFSLDGKTRREFPMASSATNYLHSIGIKEAHPTTLAFSATRTFKQPITNRYYCGYIWIRESEYSDDELYNARVAIRDKILSQLVITIREDKEIELYNNIQEANDKFKLTKDAIAKRAYKGSPINHTDGKEYRIYRYHCLPDKYQEPLKSLLLDKIKMMGKDLCVLP